MLLPCLEPLSPADSTTEIERLFDRFWSESFPAVKAAIHTRTTHIAFGELVKQHMINTSTNDDA
jgi:hypothetical protein